MSDTDPQIPGLTDVELEEFLNNNITEYDDEVTKPQTSPPPCTCGCGVLKLPGHSTWCDAYVDYS